MNDAGFEAFKREVLDDGVNRDLSEAGDGDRAEAVPEYEPGSKFFGAGDLERMASEPDAPLTEDQQVKDELLRQHHAEKFGDADPSDGLTDDQLFGMMPKPWRKDDDG